MSTNRNGGGLVSALFGKTRLAVLALFYGHEQEAFYVRQIVRAVALSPGAVQRELMRLTDAGLLVRSRQGHQVYYQANRESPIFPEVKSLMLKTAGLADVLRETLQRLANRIDVTFLYGSVLSGTARGDSDVDLMVIGHVTFAEVVAALRPAQEILRREVNPSVYTSEEFGKKVHAGHHFVTSILRVPKLFLLGGERELARVAPKRLAR